MDVVGGGMVLAQLPGLEDQAEDYLVLESDAISQPFAEESSYV